MSAKPGTQAATDAQLTADIRASTREEPVSARLTTDERVLARVTDGIYRQPGSAIRELVSNAYDADATRVIIKTDRPRFETLTIEDDGNGMTPDALAYLLRHIGGSAKRSSDGADLGITDQDDPLQSPNGRRLIGKIGIGLFSVSQLTNRFHLVTKIRGDDALTVASVVLRQYSDHGPAETDDEGNYEAGLVKVWREPTSDLDAHGTTITLTDIRPQTRDALRSNEVWAVVDADPSLDPEESRSVEPPVFHIGRVKHDDPSSFEGDTGSHDNLPWTSGDEPDIAFEKLVDAVWAQVEGKSANPRLGNIFDYYLRMVWQLSLSIPARYVRGSPFELAIGDGMYLYEIPKATRAAAQRFELAEGETILGTRSIGHGASVGDDFAVHVDDLRLARPLKFADLPQTTHAVRKPILFVGRCREEFKGIRHELSGGPLEFEAYLIWTPKVAPTEHQGVLARVHGSSGTLFDPTFMRYQVSEQTRLRQITCEIFVSQGLEAALNIDRESFNFAHPHVVYITQWLHAALRRVATAQKSIAAEILAGRRASTAAKKQAALSEVARRAWREESDDPGAEPPHVVFDEDPDESLFAEPGTYRFRRQPILGEKPARPTAAETTAERQMEALVQLLAAFELLDSLSEQQQERLLAGIREILGASAQ
ncbi:MAG: ATP-binding protein [Acidimicrobiaceae bacterium]|uniref:ATP-binding protein n=1 Tax=Candidatus Poriferisodalis multihospitum TaxID=2983191 RepID=UPI0023860747|nr:ATP-binding protein [Candidatus Poriferisodalis multihospitum]MDE0135648.1 ATP-binding protein [Acidimicrobiaceae bacterium]MDE0496103.1 ATP-binding protein [Acidimicrobiaceae bacterium]